MVMPPVCCSSRGMDDIYTGIKIMIEFSCQWIEMLMCSAIAISNLEDLNKWTKRAKKGAPLYVMPMRICQVVQKANLVLSPSLFTILNTNTNNINCD